MFDHSFAVTHATRGESTCRETFQRPQLGETLSRQFWNADLSDRLPRPLASADMHATHGELPRIRSFLSEHFPRFTEEAQGSSPDAWIATVKSSYLRRCDLIELRSGARTVGVFVGAPEDWSTYYVRIFAVVPDFQKRAAVRRFGRECVFEPLAACGVQRVTADTSPSNRAMARLFTELQFHVTGQQLCDRWGPLVRYTKFLDPKCEAAFLQRFGAAAPDRA